MVSLDPARRTAWETALSVHAQQLALTSKTKTTTPNPTPPTAASATSMADISQPQAPAETPRAPPDAAGVGGNNAVPHRAADASTSKTSLNDDLPPLIDMETYSSTAYKSRVMAAHVVEQLGRHRNDGIRSPSIVGLQGPQGCGK